MDTKIAVLYTMIDSQVNAENLANEVVARGYASCVNIVSGVLSIYAWQKKLEKSQECMMLFKTSQSKVVSLQDFILSQHPYSVPVLLSAEVEASESFLQYINTI